MIKAFMHRTWPVFILGLAGLGLALINFPHGFFEDSDVTMLLERAWEFPILGYLPSRNWGYPLYEFFIYPVIVHAGLDWAKAFSLLFYLAAIPFFYRLILDLTGERFPAFLGGLAFLAHPLSIISGNTIAETSFGVFLAVIALIFFFRHLKEKRNFDLWMTAFFCGLAVATRQDYLFFGATLGLALLVFARPSWRAGIWALAIFILAGAGPYLFLYGPAHFLNLATEFLQNDSVSRKFVRSLFGYMAILGLPSTAFLFVLAGKNLFRFRRWPVWLTSHPVYFLTGAGFLLYFIRFVLLDTKLEYVSAILLFLFLFVCVAVRKKWALALFAVTVFLPNLFQIHFFKRETTAIQADFGFSPGAILQDRLERLKQEYIFMGDYYPFLIRTAKEQFGCKKVVAYLAYSLEPEVCMIVPTERLRFLNGNRLPGWVDRRALLRRKVIVYPLPDNRGWRQFFRFSRWEELKPEMFSLLENQEGLP